MNKYISLKDRLIKTGWVIFGDNLCHECKVFKKVYIGYFIGLMCSLFCIVRRTDEIPTHKNNEWHKQ